MTKNNRFKVMTEDSAGYYVRINTGRRGSSVFFTDTTDEYPVEDKEMAEDLVARLTAKGRSVTKKCHAGTWYVVVDALVKVSV